MKSFRILFLAIPVLLAALFLVLYLNTGSELSRLKIKYSETIKSSANEKSHQVLLQDSTKYLLQLNKRNLQGNSGLTLRDIKLFKEKGLSDPVKEIIADLTRHNELIPYKGVLGGTMRFYDREIYVLNNKWVFAYFEDGHYGGQMLLNYDVSDSAGIKWTKIAAERD